MREEEEENAMNGATQFSIDVVKINDSDDEEKPVIIERSEQNEDKSDMETLSQFVR